MVEIRGNKLVFEGIELEINMPYEDAGRLLNGHIYAKADLNQKGQGIIILNDAEFYGLKGKGTLHFRQGVLKEVNFAPGWNLYDLNDENGGSLNIVEAVAKVSSDCINTLKSKFGEPMETGRYGQNTFKAGECFTITTSVSRDDDNFSVMVR